MINNLYIVMPAYNEAENIETTIKEWYPVVERLNSNDCKCHLVIANDGSKDNSSAIAHEYENQYPLTFRVIDKENGNYGSCINRGLKEAQGEYFRILDADDYVDLEALTVLLHLLSSIDVDLVFTRCIHRDTSDRVVKDEPYPTSIMVHSRIAAEDFNALEVGYWPFSMHMMTYKTSILREVHLSLSEGISYTDNEFVFYPLEKVRTIWFEDIALYQYTIGREGQTMTPALMKKRIGHFETILKRMLVYYEGHREQMQGAILSNQQGIVFSVMRWMYFLLLHSNTDEETVRILRELDDYTDRYVEFKEKVVGIEQYGFRYVNYWHQTGRNCKHPITILRMQISRLSKIITSLSDEKIRK